MDTHPCLGSWQVAPPASRWLCREQCSSCQGTYVVVLQVEEGSTAAMRLARKSTSLCSMMDAGLERALWGRGTGHSGTAAGGMAAQPDLGQWDLGAAAVAHAAAAAAVQWQAWTACTQTPARVHEHRHAEGKTKTGGHVHGNINLRGWVGAPGPSG
eukprot:1159835-Pelagomonas_calceolata.AAC.1